MSTKQRASQSTAKWRELLGITRLFTSTLDYDLVLASITEQAARLLGGEAALLLLQRRSDSLEVAASFNLPPERTAGFRLPSGSDVLPAIRDLGRPAGLPGLVATPLVLKGAIIGLLAVYRRTKRKPGTLDEELLSALADQATIAISNARLHQTQRESEERFRAVIENSRDGINMLDLATGRYTFMSPAQVALIGFTAEEINNISAEEAYERVHPDDREISILQQQRIAAGEDLPEPVEYRWKVKTGEYRWFSDSRKLVRDGQGRPIAMVGVSRDITERRRAEEQLRADLRALKRLHLLSQRPLEQGDIQPLLEEVMKAGIEIAAAKQGTLQLVEGDSLRIVAYWGHDQPFLDYFASAEMQASACGEAMRCLKPVAVPDVEISPLFAGTPSLAVLREAGVRSVLSVPMVSRKGDLLGVLTSQWDVPHLPDEHELWRIGLLARQAADFIDGKRAEEERERLLKEASRLNEKLTLSHLKVRELAEEAERRAEELETIIETVGAGLLIYDASGECIRANAAGLKMISFPSTNLAGSFAEWVKHLRLEREDASAISPDESPASQALKGETVEGWEVCIVGDEGRRAWALASATATHTPDGRITGAVVSLLDITHRRQLDQEKDDFIAMAAHELKTPLTSVKGYVQLLKRRATFSKRSREAEILETIDQQSRQLARLIDELLEVSRLAGHSLELRRSRFNLIATVIQTIANMSATTDKHNLKWTVEGKPSASVQIAVEADKDRLEQVLVNLISNGIRYSPNGGEVWVDVRRKDGRVEVAVTDPGLGIPADRQGRVFERFYRAHAGTRHNYGGMGVGLYISREIVKRHGGEMWFESEEGRGSTFYFSLPAT